MGAEYRSKATRIPFIWIQAILNDQAWTRIQAHGFRIASAIGCSNRPLQCALSACSVACASEGLSAKRYMCIIAWCT